MNPWPFLIAAIATVLLSAGEVAARTLDIRLDRNPIHDDETVRLIIAADAEADRATPDVTPLRRDFEVLGRSTNTHVSVANGVRSVRTEWIVELAPRHPGRFTIGPLRVGTVISPTIELEVLSASATAARSVRDVFMEMEATQREVYVQAQLVCVLRIWRAAEFLEAKLSDFDPEGAVTYRLGKDATYAKAVDGRQYRVIERRFAVFPQASGPLTLPAVRLDARIAEAGAASTMGLLFGEGRRLRIATQPVEVAVKPRPPAASMPWLPARVLTLAEEWAEDPPRLVTGEPVTWTLRLAAEGLAGEQLPSLDLPVLEGARTYPDQPSVATRAGAHTMQGERVHRIAIVPGAAGTITIPEIRVAWWDVESDAARTALLPARTIAVSAAAPGGEGIRAALTAPPAAPETEPRLWHGISAALALAWLATLAVLLFVLRRVRPAGSESPAPAGESLRDTATARRRVLDACRDAAPRAARDALLDWAGLAWPESSPRDLIALAARVRDEALARAILDLDRSLWSAGDTGWDGQSLAASLPRELANVPASHRPAAGGGLPSLHPV